MNETMQRIQKLSNERQQLWRKGSKISSIEVRRVQEITSELAILWDQHRREVAGDNRVRNSEYIRSGNNAA